MSFGQSYAGDMARGSRSITSAELDAHLRPMRQDIRDLVDDQKAFAEFMSGAIQSRDVQERIRVSRHFWMGTAISFATVALAAIALLVRLH